MEAQRIGVGANGEEIVDFGNSEAPCRWEQKIGREWRRDSREWKGAHMAPEGAAPWGSRSCGTSQPFPS